MKGEGRAAETLGHTRLHTVRITLVGEIKVKSRTEPEARRLAKEWIDSGFTDHDDLIAYVDMTPPDQG